MSKTLIFLAMLSSGTQDVAEQQSPQIMVDSNGNVEVIEVQGSRPLYQYRAFRDAKRKVFMSHFNDIVSEPDFKFRCERTRKYGSRMMEEVCKNEFQWRIEEEIKQYEIRQGNMFGAYAVSQVGNVETKERREDLVEEIQTLLVSDPELKSKYVDFKVADLTYQKMHQAKFGALSAYNNNDNSEQ